MVNTGKPSKGCYMCRARRIKCDEGKPSCMRCQKSRRICPGYRDLFELKLRDETKSTKCKISSGYNKYRHLTPEGLNDIFYRPHNASSAFVHTAALPPTWSESTWISYDDYPWSPDSTTTTSGTHDELIKCPRSRMAASNIFLDQPALIKQPLSTPIDQQAVNFFLTNYVLVPGPESMTSRGHLDFLLPILKSQPADSPLALTFTSVGLATMAVRPNSHALLPMASSSYIKALKKIHSALRDSRTAMSDTTLATILLLTVYEQITSSEMELRGWQSHISGAVAIIMSRGKKSFQSKFGRQLFIAVRELMTIHYIAKSLPIEPSVEWWVKGGFECEEEPIMQAYATFNLRVAQLRQDNDKTTTLSPATPANTEAVLSLLRRAQELEREYREWYSSPLRHWKAEAIAWVDWSDLSLEVGSDLKDSIVHPGRVDSYKELTLGYAYNVARSSQILIWTTILRCVAWLGDPGDYRITPEHRKAAEICSVLIEDIVASVPYFFGWNSDTDPTTASSLENNIDGSVKGVSGVFLIWPLFVACSSDFASDSQKSFLRGRLAFIADKMGICQARILLNAPLRHPSLHIMHERVNLRRGNYPSPTFSSSTQSSTSLTASPASLVWAS